MAYSTLERAKNRRRLLSLVCITVGLSAAWLALEFAFPPSPNDLTIASGRPSGAFEHIAKKYKERLQEYGVNLHIRFTSGVGESLALVTDKNVRVDAAFLFGGTSNSSKSPELWSLGRINYGPIWFFYRGDASIDRLSQMKGKRIAINPGAVDGVIKVLAANGVTQETANIIVLNNEESTKRLLRNELDVVSVTFDVNSPVVQLLMRAPGVRLVNLINAEAIARTVEGVSRIVLPRGAIDLESDIPAVDIQLLALTNVIVVRKELHPQLIYQLAKAIQEQHVGAGVFQRVGEFPSLNETEFPVAPIAKDFYKDGPSLWDKYLPFWITVYAKRSIAIAIAAFAVVLPLFNYTPKLLRWYYRERLAHLYETLSTIERQLHSDLSEPQLLELQRRAEAIDKESGELGVPHRFSDVLFSFKIHVNLVRARISTRLNELRDRSTMLA